jgi:hypothetical protein
MPPPATRKPPIRATAVSGDVATAPPPEHKKIARLAYAYWQGRGCPDGSPEEDWFRAEEELRRRQSAYKAAKDRRNHVPRAARTASRSRKSAA